MQIKGVEKDNLWSSSQFNRSIDYRYIQIYFWIHGSRFSDAHQISQSLLPLRYKECNYFNI